MDKELTCIICGKILTKEESKNICCLGNPSCQECFGYPLEQPLCEDCKTTDENLKHIRHTL